MRTVDSVTLSSASGVGFPPASFAMNDRSLIPSERVRIGLNAPPGFGTPPTDTGPVATYTPCPWSLMSRVASNRSPTKSTCVAGSSRASNWQRLRRAGGRGWSICGGPEDGFPRPGGNRAAGPYL